MKIDCEDQKGLVHEISGILYRQGLNIVENEEYVDRESGHFFMRSEVTGDLQSAPLLDRLRDKLPQSAHIRLHQQEKRNIVVLATREYHCLGDLLVRHQFGDLNANILAVISNHNALAAFVDQFNIAFHHVPAEGLSKAVHEKNILSVLQAYDAEYLVLAKYMRIFTAGFTQHYPHRIINIHHSFLPAFVGAKPYEQAYTRGVKMIGATAHFVNDDLDEGPIITQDVIHTNHKNDAKALARLGRDVEKQVLAKALKLVLDDRVFVHNNKTVILE